MRAEQRSRAPVAHGPGLAFAGVALPRSGDASAGSTVRPSDSTTTDDAVQHDQPTGNPGRPHPTVEATVEAELRGRLADELGGLRGSLEMALPLVVFTIANVVSGDLTSSLVAGGVAALCAYALRVVQGSTTRYARHGLIGIAIGALVATSTGRAQDAFLPGIVQNGVMALLLGGSLVVRWPLAGFLVGTLLEDMTGWREHPALRSLADRLTLVLLAPLLVRLVVQLPLYLAGEIGWLGLARLVLGWPLHVATLAIALLILLRGSTPMPGSDQGYGA